MVGLTSLWILGGCAFTDYGVRISEEHRAIAQLENKRKKLENQYIILMNHLETYPTDMRLIEDRDKVRRKLQETVWELDQKRQFFDLSLKEWEEKIIQDRIQQEMIQKEVQENAHKEEGIFPD